MVTQKHNKYPIVVRITIERYEDGKPGNKEMERVRSIVLDYANEIIKNPPEDSLVTLADYFDLCGSMVYDRYEEDEKGQGEDFGEEDRWCVEMHFVARFTIEGADCIKARTAFWERLNDEVIGDAIDESIEHYATNFNANELNFIR